MADWGGLATIQRPPGLVWGQPGEGLDGLFTPRGGDWGGLGGTGTRVGTVWPTVAPHPRAMWPQTRLAGSLQVNEVVFSPSESHCATCCDDGSMRVWSLTSMELVIQLQVLNQVLWGSRVWGLVPRKADRPPLAPPAPEPSLWPCWCLFAALGLGPRPTHREADGSPLWPPRAASA